MRAKVITLILVIMVGMAAFTWWSAYRQTIFSELEGKLAAELTETLGTKVTIGRLQTAGFTSAAVDDVTIFDKEGREMAAVKQVVIQYNLLSLLHGQTAIDALNTITLRQPAIHLIEEANGVWNAECLRQQTKPDSPEFKGKVVLEQADILVQSHQGEWDFHEIDGHFIVNGSQTVDASLTASHNALPLAIQGSLNNVKNSLWLSVTADTLNPADYQALLPAGTEVEFSNGLLRQVAITLVNSPAGLRYAGKFELDNLAAQTAGIPVEQAYGNVQFTNENVYIASGRALVAQQPVTVYGKIGIAGDQPVFDLKVGSNGFDPTAFSDRLPCKGIVKFDAQVTGTLHAPVVAAKLTADQLAIDNYSLEAAKANLKYAGNTLTVDSLTAGTLGGQIQAKGELDTVSNRFQLQLSGDNLDVAAIENLPVEITGKGQVQLAVSGQGTDWQSLTGVAAVTLTTGELNGVPYNTLSTFVERNGNQTTVQYLNAALPNNGFASASGVIQGDQLAMKVNGQGIALQAMPATAFGNIKLAGNAAFNGEITGTTTAPGIALNFDITGLQANEQLLGKAAGALTMHSGRLELAQVVVSDGTASHEANGSILLAGSEPELNLTVTTHAARAETFARLAMPEFTLTGNVEHTLILTGPLTNPTLQGKVKLTEGSLFGQLITKAEGTYERKDGTLIVHNLEVDSLGTHIKLAGAMAADSSLNFAVTTENMRLSQLRVNYPYPVAGRVNINGQITGTLASPRLDGQLAAPRIFLNGQEIKNIFSRLSYQDGHADIRELHFSQGTGEYSYAGAADLNTKAIDGILRVENGELAGILAIANLPDRGVRGTLNGEIALSGTTTNPNVLLRGAITDGRIKNYRLDSIDIDAELDNRVITINKFTGKQGADGVLLARGQADLDGTIDMEVGGRDIETGILPALFDTTVDTTGKFSFSVQASGATADPNVAISLGIQNGSVANAAFDNLYGLFIYNKGSIHVNQLYLERGPYKASAYGTIPLKALNSQGRSQADMTDRMDLKLRLDNADLSILPMLSKHVAWAAGPTAGEVTIGGTLAQPTLDGQLTVNNGTIKFADLGEPIQNVGIAIQFKNDTIDISDFDGRMGGGSYALSGTARLRGLSLDDYNLVLTLEHLGIKHKYFAGPLDGVVSLTNEKGKPQLYGKLTIDNATVNIPAVPEGGEIDWDAGLDVEVALGNKVRMYNPYLYDFLAEGKVKFAGTLQKPQASGRIEARRGTVRYLTNRFNIERGSAEFIQHHSIVPIIKLKANARLQQTRVDLEINGPATAMNLLLTSDPPMSQQEIITILTLRGGDFSKANGQSKQDSILGRDQLVSLLDAGLQMRFVSEIENAMQNALKVDEFRFVKSSIFDTYSNKASKDNSDSSFQGYNLEIGKYLTDKLLLSYTMDLDQKTNSVSLRYDLTKRIAVGGTFGGDHNGLFILETKVNF
ncbi:translocation/assembly module TamB domain-containing protein [Sporomusa acidovorans]|uniref:Translocation and assembly module TamB C-terminal domain-containing protein n=1 Tax=Sporomusa acidovorans (strain ATCC 49682 / DSM 3132 / Mol) TaxID=1123286 RepID=A0ABZ3J822_SPOA4|nr:translocation/assembly module TamB domain-containing protein [Sporomusa acidovorans]OZC19280.1 putative assembly protein [Sporomusa acidovorans DSM 3132]SDD82013.1 translocation and assembly module TamB [Sporomusa acidovorans]